MLSESPGLLLSPTRAALRVDPGLLLCPGLWTGPAVPARSSHAGGEVIVCKQGPGTANDKVPAQEKLQPGLGSFLQGCYKELNIHSRQHLDRGQTPWILTKLVLQKAQQGQHRRKELSVQPGLRKTPHFYCSLSC